MADWMCPHTPDICDYAEQCATKLGAEIAILKKGEKPASKFVQVTSGGWSQVLSIDQIARIYKDEANPVRHEDDQKLHPATTVVLKNGDKVVVEESIKTLQCRIGCELMP